MKGIKKRRSLQQCWMWVLVCAFMGCMATSGYAQSEAQAGDELLIQHQTDSTLSAVVHIDQRFRAWPVEGKRITGPLKAVTDSSYVIGEREIKFASTVKLRAYAKHLGVRKVKNWARLCAWPVLTGLGVILIGALIGVILSFFSLFLVVVMLLAAMVAAVGLAVLMLSIVVLMNDNTPATTFKLGETWRLKATKKK